MQKEKIRALIWKAFEISFRYLLFVKIDLAFCLGTFKRNVRLTLVILTLTLNKKGSSEVPFKQTNRRVSLIQQFFFILYLWNMLRGRKNGTKTFPYR